MGNPQKDLTPSPIISITEGSEMNELWNKYYAEYIQKHKSDGKDVFQLTNEAINYCMEKLRLGSVTETR